jgi:general stress protein YciG
MDLGRLADEAKHLVEERGGVDSLAEDAEEMKDIATGGGSVADKAKAAAEAIKDPGAPGQ